MESVYHIVTIRVNETSWAHVWRLRSRYLRTGYDKHPIENRVLEQSVCITPVSRHSHYHELGQRRRPPPPAAPNRSLHDQRPRLDYPIPLHEI
jgi:hypothetical protein